MSGPRRDTDASDYLFELETELAGLGVWFDHEVESSKSDLDGLMPGEDPDTVKTFEDAYQSALQSRKGIEEAEESLRHVREEVDRLKAAVRRSISQTDQAMEHVRKLLKILGVNE